MNKEDTCVYAAGRDATYDNFIICGANNSVKTIDIKECEKCNKYKSRIDKRTYINIVRFTLGTMLDQARNDKTYNLLSDTVNYYLSKIKPDGQLTEEEFLRLCKEVETERKGDSN